jgi:short-subunit dehydrogenase
MRIFISGATGYIGELLAFKLANEGHTVIALARSLEKAQKLMHDNISIVVGDISNEDKLCKAMDNCHAVFHLAACASVCPDPGQYYKINVTGTRSIMEAALLANVKRIVFTSTAGVFGPSASNIPIDENIKREIPFFNEYESSKAEAEKIVLSYMDRLEVVIVNPSRVYGPGEASESNAITKLVKLYKSGKWKILPGDGTKIGNYVYVGDVVDGHVLALNKAPNGSQYLLGGENASYNQLFQTIRDATQIRKSLYKMPIPAMVFASHLMVLWAKINGTKPLITPNWVRKYLYDWALTSEKATNELGYNITSLKEGIQITSDALDDQAIKNTYALITGASSGIGRSIAFELAQKGHNLVLVALPETGLIGIAATLEKRYRVKVHIYETDLIRPGTAENLHRYCTEHRLPINILVNNAGMSCHNSFAHTPIEEIRKVMYLNMDSLVAITKLFVPELKKQNCAYILNVGSLASFLPLPFKSIYSGSKSFVYNFSKALKAELSEQNIYVSCLCPGPTDTNSEMIKIHKMMGWKSKLLVISSENVAKKAVKGMFKKKGVIIPGINNRISMALAYLLPSFLLMLILKIIFRKKYKKEPSSKNIKMASPEMSRL